MTEPKYNGRTFSSKEKEHARKCLDAIIKLAKTTRALAILMGVTQPNIIRWKSEGVPPHHVVKLCHLSGNKYKPSDFRPDVFY